MTWPTDADIRRILTSVKSIALVGASANPARPSYIVLKYLSGAVTVCCRSIRGSPASRFCGAMAYASLAQAPGPIDMVEIFRASEYAGAVVDEALALDPLPRVIWMQLGVEDAAAAERARARGVEVGDEPLPEDRVGPALRRDRLARRQFAHHLRRASRWQAPDFSAFRWRSGIERPRRRYGACAPRGRSNSLTFACIHLYAPH